MKIRTVSRAARLLVALLYVAPRSKWATAAEVAAAAGLTVQQASVPLLSLARKRLVRRAGKEGAYKYKTSAAGKVLAEAAIDEIEAAATFIDAARGTV